MCYSRINKQTTIQKKARKENNGRIHALTRTAIHLGI